MREENRWFQIGERVVLNQNANKGLPNNVGEVCEVVRYINSDNYDLEVDFGGHINPVKENELNKLTKEQEQLVTYIHKGNTVVYKLSNEEVKILKTDFIHGQVEVLFDDGASCIVGMETLKELKKESDRVEEKTRSDLHREVIEEIHNTFKIKNADYGNSFGEQYEEYGLLSAVIRLDDKMRRLKQLMKQDAQVKDESIRDTVLDLANYAIMTVMELDK